MRLFAACAAFVALAASASALVIPRDANDPFYTPDDGWKDKQPGDILKWRSIQPKFLEQDYSVAEAYQLLYRTSHNHADEPSHTVTTILIPHNAKRDHLVVGSSAQDANGPQCSPSAGYTYNSASNILFMLDETIFMQYLNEGYVLTVPDKEGPIGAFAAGRMEGHMVLDGIRATLNFDKINLPKDTRIAGYGYSGGAISLGWAASLKPVYAPELNVIAWSMGGTPVTLKDTIDTLDSTLFSGLVVSGITGVMDAYPEIYQRMNKYINDNGHEAIAFAKKNCAVDVIFKYPFKSIYSYEFQTKGATIFDDPVIQAMFKETNMGQHPKLTPDAPVFMYHAVHDGIIPYDPAHTTAKSWCANGAQVYFETYSHIEHGHITTEFTGSVPAFHYIRDRFNGKPAPSGCHFVDEGTLFFDPSVLGGVASQIANDLFALFGKKIGPESKILAAKQKVVLKPGQTY
ncbi:hypothetical protein MCUN1_003793 [Malassezia cuniculi]|uniref:triacylglycerol lipase n=1 Tax=Malassezia cuniculi TaxID=948313 RepID=A0AAF0EY66_9BASI|nr:hypothetical protein MCUN1_003793 [Malassezia cuniculi]